MGRMLNAESLALPARPAHLADRPAAIWEEPLRLPTYEPLPAERYPMYLDRRVYQGSSGRVYPLPFHHQISADPVARLWRAVHLENEWLRLVVLPELGGRLHVARDRASGRDIFYCNPVIKPALVGLAGPWIAGGIELNWPQHHRPGTFLPTDVHVDNDPDGSVVVWCSDHDPFSRMKGMHGFRLRPDSSAIELDVRLYNRAETRRSFLWWANVAARADDDYQAFFPNDVTHVADHARRAITSFPSADRPYYGVRYSDSSQERYRAADGTELTGDRIDWYRNIPVPTSYMVLGSSEDFFGGYDHADGIGFVHVADHQIAVGKKLWTWGNAPFGHAWDRNLADDGAHYVELMAGVFTDNQPDFAYLAPGETKVFTQRWYPIRDIGPVDRASADCAVSLRREGEEAHVGVMVTRSMTGLRVVLTGGGQTLLEEVVDLDPGRPSRIAVSVPIEVGSLTVTVGHGSRQLLSWTAPACSETSAEPRPAQEPPLPDEIEAVEELAMVAQHLELYRHATRAPEPYWREALRRDPEHVGSLIGLASRAYGAGDATTADRLLSRARARLTRYHENPSDTRALYLHGLVRESLGDDDGAYDLFGRSSWMRLWRAPAGYRMARIDARNGRYGDALHRLADVLRTEPEHLQALALTVICHRNLGERGADSAAGHSRAAARTLTAARNLDPLDACLRVLDGDSPSGDPQTCLDVAIELIDVGELDAGLRCLAIAEELEDHRAAGQTAGGPMIAYHRADALERSGRLDEAVRERARTASIDPTDCYPSRLADAAVLFRAARADATDSRARALLGHWARAVGRHELATRLWEQSAALDANDAVVQRNLGLSAADDARDLAAAVRHYEAAIALRPDDARLMYERDQLAALAAEPVSERLARLDRRLDLVESRDDLTVEYVHLLISDGRLNETLIILQQRSFQTWEGGEGQVLQAWERTHVQLASQARAASDPTTAVTHLQAALRPPATLGEARHPLASTAAIQLHLGDALADNSDFIGADRAWNAAAAQRGDFTAMSPASHSETTFWSVLALRRIGDGSAAVALEEELAAFRDRYAATPPAVDYFATSLPDLLLFAPDPKTVQRRRIAVFDAQLALLRGDRQAAEQALQSDDVLADRHGYDLCHAINTLGPGLLVGPVQATGASV